MTQKSSFNTGIAANRVWVAALAGGVFAALGNLLLLGAAGALGFALQIPATPGSTALQPLGVGPVIGASLIPALVAGALFWLLSRVSARPWRIFLIVAGVFLLLSFGGPLNLPVDGATKLALGLMHLVAGAAIVGSLARFARAG